MPRASGWPDQREDQPFEAPLERGFFASFLETLALEIVDHCSDLPSFDTVNRLEAGGWRLGLRPDQPCSGEGRFRGESLARAACVNLLARQSSRNIYVNLS